MTAPPASPPSLATLRAAMTRAENLQGIPMVLALVDERGSIPVAVDPAVLEDGAQIAGVLACVHRDLCPSMPDGDYGSVVSALVVAAHDLIELGEPHAGPQYA